jgi:hypothetical protein
VIGFTWKRGDCRSPKSAFGSVKYLDHMVRTTTKASAQTVARNVTRNHERIAMMIVGDRNNRMEKCDAGGTLTLENNPLDFIKTNRPSNPNAWAHQ